MHASHKHSAQSFEDLQAARGFTSTHISANELLALSQRVPSVLSANDAPEAHRWKAFLQHIDINESDRATGMMVTPPPAFLSEAVGLHKELSYIAARDGADMNDEKRLGVAHKAQELKSNVEEQIGGVLETLGAGEAVKEQLLRSLNDYHARETSVKRGIGGAIR